MLKGQTWGPAENKQLWNSRECHGNVFGIHSKNVLNNYLPSHVLFSYTVVLVLLPLRGEISVPSLSIWHYVTDTVTSEARS